jgi:CheY-like chemotaxis protein
VDGGAGEGGEQSPDAELAKGEAELIVLAEDADSLRAAVQDFLQTLGYRVQSAPDGEQALGILERTRPDLLITDIVMPKMGGKALLHHARTRYPTLPVIAITGYILETEIQSLLDEGFDAVLSKPFDIEALINLVREML